MTYDIILGRFSVKHLLSCEVRSSANQLADVATLTLNAMAYNAALEVESKIKRGDAVSIAFGYDGKNVVEFTGYIRTIGTGEEITIECEDEMYVMRKAVANKQYAHPKAMDIIQDLAQQVGVQEVVSGEGVADVSFDKFTVQDATAIEVLEKLKQETGLHIFFVGKVLHVHLKYTYNAGAVRYDFSKNVEAANLTYARAEDKTVEVEVVGITKKNEKVTVVVGEKGGDKITVHRYNVTDPNSLTRIGEEELKKYNITGYEGDLTTWLIPAVKYGASATVIDELYPEREGTYYVDAVTTTFNENGGKRKVTLGLKLA